MRRVWPTALSMVLASAFGCVRASLAPGRAVAEPIVIVPAPPTKQRVGAAKAARAPSTERYTLAFSKRTRVDGADQPLRVDLIADRLVTFDLWPTPIDTVDDRIRVATGLVDGKPQWEACDVRVRSEARGGARVEGGSAEQRALVEQSMAMIHALVPEKQSTEQAEIGAKWRTQQSQAVAYKGALLTLHHDIELRKLGMKTRGGDQTAYEIEVRGGINSDPISVGGRALVGRGFIAGTTWLGHGAETAFAVHMEFMLRDATSDERVGLIADDIGYAALPSDRATDDMAVARASFDADSAEGCLMSLFKLPSGTVFITMAPRDGVSPDRVYDGHDGVLPDSTGAHWDVNAAASARISEALIAKRYEFMACAATQAPSAGLTLDLNRRPFEVSAPFNLKPTQVACVARLVGERLEQVDLGNARHLKLVFATGHPGPEEQQPLPDRAAKSALSKEQIRTVIGGHDAQVRACYERALVGWPRLQGRIVVKFGIGSDGSIVRAVPVRDDMGLTGLACCIVQAVKSWRFPAPKDGNLIIVEYPFVLSTQE